MKLNFFILITLRFAAVCTLFAIYPADRVRAETVYVTAGLYQNPPKIYSENDGTPAGIFPEILSAIAEREGWRIRYKTCVWNECLHMLQSGQIDLMPDTAVSPDRSDIFMFHEIPVIHSWSGIWSDPALRIMNFSDLNGLRIAVLSGSLQEKNLQELARIHSFFFHPVIKNTFDDAFKAVTEGEADAVVSNIHYAASRGRIYKLRESPLIFNPAALYFAANQNTDPRILKSIDYYLSAWKQNPESVYYRILKKSMVQPGQFIIPAYLKYFIYFTLAVIIGLGSASLYLRTMVRKRTAQLQRANEIISQVLKASPAVLYQLRETPAGFEVYWISENAESILGYKISDIKKNGWWSGVLYPEDSEKTLNTFNKIKDLQHIVYEYRIKDSSGKTRWIRDEMQYYPQSSSSPAMIAGSWNDISEEKEKEKRIIYYSTHDSLTGLPNRLLLKQKLAESVRLSLAKGTGFSLFSLDLDRFKTINETLGFDGGDELLRKTSDRLLSLVSDDDIIARAGGDEFVLIIKGITENGSAGKFAEKIISVLSDPFLINNREIILHTSIGISICPNDSEDPDTILKNAEIARYAAKSLGRSNYQIFASGLSEKLRRNINLEADLRKALKNNEFFLQFQPQLNIMTGEITGTEALLRWNHPEQGLISPDLFIPLAEQNGLMNEIGLWVLEQACMQLVRWDSSGLRIPRIAVNLSARQIESDDLINQIQHILKTTGLDASRLELELTESAIINNPENAMKEFVRFRKSGISLALDDFGTGYSSLAYLKNLPINVLKIDKSFVIDCGSGGEGDALCQAVIQVAKALRLKTIAEGVETQEQALFLISQGCDTAQGYLYSRPVSAQDFPSALERIRESFERKNLLQNFN